MKIDPGMTYIDLMCEVIIYSSSCLEKERSFNLVYEFCRRWNFSMYCALHDEESQRMNMMFETCIRWKVEEILSSTPHKKNRKEYSTSLIRDASGSWWVYDKKEFTWCAWRAEVVFPNNVSRRWSSKSPKGPCSKFQIEKSSTVNSRISIRTWISKFDCDPARSRCWVLARLAFFF